MKYRTIVADPPWEVAQRSPWGGIGSWGGPSVPHVLPYSTMSKAAISELPVDELADEDAHLFLWVVNCQIETAYAIVRAWDFTPRTLLTWAKTPRGLGLGGTFTQTTEHVLFARRGRDVRIARSDSTWFRWPRGEHSRKPDAFLDLVETVSPGPYLELFARRNRLGWDTWGDEALEHVAIVAPEAA